MNSRIITLQPHRAEQLYRMWATFDYDSPGSPARDRDRRMDREQAKLARQLLFHWTPTPNDPPPDTSVPPPVWRGRLLKDHPIWIKPGLVHYQHEQLPVVVHNIGVVRAVWKLGEPVQVEFREHTDEGHTFGNPISGAEKRAAIGINIGRRAAEVTADYISNRLFQIVSDTEHMMSRNPHAPEWFPPRSHRLPAMSALLSSINRWGHDAPDVWKSFLDTPRFSNIQKKLTRAFVDSLLPLDMTGLANLLELQRAVDLAHRLTHRRGGDEIIPLHPLPTSALVWPCYARHPVDRSADPPLRTWLLAAAHGAAHDHYGAATAPAMAIRAEMAGLATARAGRHRLALPPRDARYYYQNLTVRLVRLWIKDMTNVRLDQARSGTKNFVFANPTGGNHP